MDLSFQHFHIFQKAQPTNQSIHLIYLYKKFVGSLKPNAKTSEEEITKLKISADKWEKDWEDFKQKNKFSSVSNEKTNAVTSKEKRKPIVEQVNKLKEEEITKDKAIAAAKEKELIAVQENLNKKIAAIKEQEKKALQKVKQEETEANQKELKQHDIIVYSLIGGLFIILVIAAIKINSVRIKNKKKI